jgi:hypothetical protein
MLEDGCKEAAPLDPLEERKKRVESAGDLPPAVDKESNVRPPGSIPVPQQASGFLALVWD